LFRRKSESTVVVDTTAKPGGKGRPTPSRKEAEAARMARVRTPRSRKEQAAASRSARFESSQKMREAMKTGDERYLPARDRGPLRRFTRDFVDSRFTLAELILPLLVVTMVLGFVGNTALAVFGNFFMTLVLVAVAANLIWLRFRLHRQVKERFPDASRQGLTYYAVVRAVQLRFLRMPKPQVRIGQELPDTYR
jgi:Flp pilus assembly protein TadB